MEKEAVVEISCDTEGVSIGVKVIKKGVQEPAEKHTIESWE